MIGITGQVALLPRKEFPLPPQISPLPKTISDNISTRQTPHNIDKQSNLSFLPHNFNRLPLSNL